MSESWEYILSEAEYLLWNNTDRNLAQRHINIVAQQVENEAKEQGYQHWVIYSPYKEVLVGGIISKSL